MHSPTRSTRFSRFSDTRIMLTAESQQTAEPTPRHIAIIMDGNGRWAAARNLPRVEGHRRGARAVRRTVKACREFGVSYLTLYAFSSENWNRSSAEISDLMTLLRIYLKKEIDELDRNDVRVGFIGDRGRLAPDIIELIETAENVTRDNRSLTLTVALNYGGHAEIAGAARKLADDVAGGRLKSEDITEDLFSAYLDTADLPDPDLIIRTSGEKRLSNFLLWQAAYSELIFLDVYWPDFDRESLIAAIEEFRSRERRYGAARG